MKKCKKCGAPLEGFLFNTIGKIMGIKPSEQDPEVCNKCAEAKPAEEASAEAPAETPAEPQAAVEPEAPAEPEVAAEPQAAEAPAEEEKKEESQF